MYSFQNIPLYRIGHSNMCFENYEKANKIKENKLIYYHMLNYDN